MGHTGAGKTTLAALLLRLYDVQQGAVLVDGLDVREWEISRLRQQFSMVQQDVHLFSGNGAGQHRARGIPRSATGMRAGRPRPPK